MIKSVGGAPVPRTITTMAGLIGDELTLQRFVLSLFGAFATLALILAAFGLYTLMNYLVIKRTGEIGLRMAIGARPGQVIRLIVWDGMRTTFAGALVGGVIAVAFARLIARFVYWISPRDLVAFCGAPVLLAFIALVASYLPARRAARIDPMRLSGWNS